MSKINNGAEFINKTPPKQTEPIVKRTINVYLPSIATADRWKKTAKTSGMTISKWIQEHVENSLKDEWTNGSGPRRKLQQEIDHLHVELDSAKTLIESLQQIDDKLDKVLRREQIERFAIPKFQGERRFDRELIDLFKHRSFLPFTEILGLLKIKPDDVEVVKGIDEQLKDLDRLGVIQREPDGWRWRG